MHIENKTAVITGAGGGIGQAVAEKLAVEGAKAMALVDLSDGCVELAERLNRETGRDVAVAFTGDVTDQDFRRSVFGDMEKQFGPVNLCIPAAGILKDALAVKLDADSGEVVLYAEADFEQVLSVNLVHPTYWAMETIAGIARSRHSRGLGKWQPDETIEAVVILIGSVSSRGNRGQVSYSAAKSALTAVSATLNVEGLYHGVQTKIIHPGFVDTPMVDSMDAEYFESRLKPLIGLGRKISPGEIGDIVCAMIENPVLSGEVWADASLTPLV